MQIILASGSARRRELMENCGYTFTVMPSSADEHIEANTPEELVERLAVMKAADVFSRLNEDEKKEAVVIGSDTVVVLDGKILGKPSSKEHAARMLRAESGRTNFVHTGLAVVFSGDPLPLPDNAVRLDGGACALVGSDTASVRFAELTDDEIKAYVDSGDPLDKAGAYGIQGPFSVFIEGIEGSYFTVVGLPVHLLYKMLRALTILPFEVRRTVPNAETKAALAEYEEMRKNPGAYKRYGSFEELVSEVPNDD